MSRLHNKSGHSGGNQEYCSIFKIAAEVLLSGLAKLGDS